MLTAVMTSSCRMSGSTFAAVDRAAEDAVQVVEAVDRFQGEEELRAVGVGSGVGHGEDAGVVVAQAGSEFIGELVARSAFTVAERIAALHDEVGHDAVEFQAVEIRRAGLRPERAFRQTGEAGDRERDLRGENSSQITCAVRGHELGVESGG
jgi:hypothetical protein